MLALQLKQNLRNQRSGVWPCLEATATGDLHWHSMVSPWIGAYCHGNQSPCYPGVMWSTCPMHFDYAIKVWVSSRERRFKEYQSLILWKERPGEALRENTEGDEMISDSGEKKNPNKASQDAKAPLGAFLSLKLYKFSINSNIWKTCKDVQYLLKSRINCELNRKCFFANKHTGFSRANVS